MPAYAGAIGAKLVTFYPMNVGIHMTSAVAPPENFGSEESRKVRS